MSHHQNDNNATQALQTPSNQIPPLKLQKEQEKHPKARVMQSLSASSAQGEAQLPCKNILFHPEGEVEEASFLTAQ